MTKTILLTIFVIIAAGLITSGTVVYATHQPEHDATGEGNAGAIHSQQDAIDDLQLRVAELESQNSQLLRLLEFILVDTPNVGDLTIRTLNSDIILDPADTGEVKLEGDLMNMGDATVMGTAELEGDTMMMQDATVMGTTELEGDTMMMQDATVMGTTELEGDVMAMEDATVSGLFSLAGQTFALDGTRILDPTSSFMTITGANDGIFSITPLPPGIELTLAFQPDPGTDIGLFNCQPSGSCLPGGANIILNSNFDGVSFELGETIQLTSDGTFWYEEIRSNSAYVYLEPNVANIPLSGGSELISCKTNDAGISATSDSLPAGVTIEQVRAYGDDVFVRFDNTSGSHQTFDVFAVCVSASDLKELP